MKKGKEAALIKLAHDKDEEVKLAAIAGMGKIGKDDSFNAIVPDMLTDEDPKVRAAAAEALGVMQNEHANAHLRYYLEREKDPAVIAAMRGGHCQPGRGLTLPISQKKRGRPLSKEGKAGRFFCILRVLTGPWKAPSGWRGSSRTAAGTPAFPWGVRDWFRRSCHLADAAADALVQLDGPGGQLQLFQAASRSTELRVISPFFSISCKMPVTVERRMENWAWISR